MCKELGASLGGFPQVSGSMKAVLEFNYPEDEDRLRWALHGGKAIGGLNAIRSKIRTWEKHNGANHEELIEQIRALTNETLTECGEE